MSSFPSFRRTLSYDDLANASDEEMNNLLSLDDDKNEEDTDHQPNSNQNHGNNNHNHSSSAAIIDVNDTAPILQLDESTGSMTRSKSVRFQEPEEISNKRREDDALRQVKVQVEEVKGVMRDNVSRLLDREASLDNLSDRSEQLHQSSDIYRQSSDMLRRKLYWRQMRTRLTLTAVAVICVFLILVPLITKFV